MKPKIILYLTLVLFIPFSNLCASEPPANSPPQIGIHDWEYIQYPWDLPKCPFFLIGWPSGGNERSDEMSRGLRMDILNIVQGFEFFKTNVITARLYRADGEIVELTEEGKKLLNAPISVSTASYPGMKPVPQVMTYFPWGTNALEESWIEISMGLERYWVEIPYGFDRNPADPLPPSFPGGPPKFVPAMKSLTDHDHVMRWQTVHYDLGQTQDGGELSLIQSNPFDAVSDVDIYNYPKAQNVYSPHTAVRLLNADGTVIKGQCVNLHLDDSRLRRTDTFEFGRHGDDMRCWGQIEISVDDKSYRVVVPSSLYKYIHGHAFTPAATDFPSTLHVGMTLREVDQVLRNYNCTRKSAPTSSVRHQDQYVFTPDASVVTLQFDEADTLVSWK